MIPRNPSESTKPCVRLWALFVAVLTGKGLDFGCEHLADLNRTFLHLW